MNKSYFVLLFPIYSRFYRNTIIVMTTAIAIILIKYSNKVFVVPINTLDIINSYLFIANIANLSFIS